MLCDLSQSFLVNACGATEKARVLRQELYFRIQKIYSSLKMSVNAFKTFAVPRISYKQTVSKVAGINSSCSLLPID